MDHYSQSGMSMGSPKPPRSIFGKILTILLFLLLIGAVAGVGYLYWQEMDKTAKLEAQVSGKNTEIEKLKSEAPAAAKAEYTADVGKFKLTLPAKYFIAVNLDGPFEGGPATSLTVGIKNDQGQQTITMPAHESVAITATPASGTFDNYVKGKLDDGGGLPNKKLPNVKIDGVDAQVYEFEGLFTDRKIFFQKNNIFYEIKAGNFTDSKISQESLDEVIKGFKFS